MNKEEILKGFQFRHACKEFDKGKMIPREDLNFILETGRLSPSSFGLEPWKFLVISSPELKEKLQQACFDQKQVGTASDVVVVLAKKGLYDAGSSHVAEMFRRWNYPEEVYNFVIGFHAKMAESFDQVKVAVEQCHIAAANMMTAGAMIDIDSCPIGGFMRDKAREALDLDGDLYEVALIIPFGYRANPQQPPKTRLSFDEVVEFR